MQSIQVNHGKKQSINCTVEKEFCFQMKKIIFACFFVFEIDSRPYALDIHDDTLIVMIYNRTDSTYDEIWIDKFGRVKTDQYRKFQKPMIIRYIHEYKYPTKENSNSKKRK